MKINLRYLIPSENEPIVSPSSLLSSQSGNYSKTCVKLPLSKRPKIGFQDQLSLNAGQKYCRMLQGEHSAILSTFIKLSFIIKIFVLFFVEWPFYTGFTVCKLLLKSHYWKQQQNVCSLSKYSFQPGLEVTNLF